MTERPTLAEARAEIERELRLRAGAYPRFVANGKLRQADADRQIARLRAALEYLPQPEPGRDLFSAGGSR